MFVINQPTRSCCGQSANNCSCGGGSNDGYQYSGRYAGEVVSNERPKLKPELEWNFTNEFLDNDKPAPVQASRSGSAARVDNSAPTPMPQLDWVFTNEFASNRR